MYVPHLYAGIVFCFGFVFQATDASLLNLVTLRTFRSAGTIKFPHWRFSRFNIIYLNVHITGISLAMIKQNHVFFKLGNNHQRRKEERTI